MSESRLPYSSQNEADGASPRLQWIIAAVVAVVYSLATNAGVIVRAAQVGRWDFFQAALQTVGGIGFAFVAAGAALDFVTGLIESFRTGMEYDHD